MRHPRFAVAFAATIASMTATVAFAGEFSLGIAAGTLTRQYHYQDDQTFVIPVIAYEGERFSYFLDTAAFQLLSGEHGETGWRTRMLARARIFDQPAAAAGLEKRRSTLDAGFEVAAQGPWGAMSLEGLADTLDRHDGFEASLTYSYDLALTSQLSITPRIGVSYQDRRLADYYFGVRPSEAKATRPEYHPDAGGSATAGLTIAYAMTSRWQLLAVMTRAALSDDLADSPLIAKRSTTTAVIGVMYRF